MKSMSKRWLLAAAFTIVAVAAVVGSQALDGSGGDALAGPTKASVRAGGLGPISGLLPRDHLTEESAIQVDLSKESVRLPLYKGKANGETVWYVAPRRLRSGDRPRPRRQLRAQARQPRASAAPDCVQTVTLDSPTPDQNKFGQARRQLPGRARLQPDPDRRARARPASRWRSSSPAPWPAPGYSPFIRIAGSQTVYSAPIVATGDGPFDVVHHTEHRRPRARHPHRRAVGARASTPSRGSTCCSSRASTPASRSSTSRPTPASR